MWKKTWAVRTLALTAIASTSRRVPPTTGTGSVSELPYSREVTVRLNPLTHAATLVRSADQPERLSASSQGNGQTLRDGDVFVGWGSLPYISQFSPSGSLLFNARLPAGVNTYRAYRFDWK